MAKASGFWRVMERIGLGGNAADVVFKVITLVGTLGTVIWGYIDGLGAFVIPAAFVTAAGGLGAISYFKRLNSSQQPRRSSEAPQPELIAPAYNRSFQQLVLFSSNSQSRRLADLRELEAGQIDDRVIALADIPRDSAMMSAIKNKRFNRCTIIGPGIVFLINSPFFNNRFLMPGQDRDDFEHVLWPVESGAYKVGLFAAVDCSFVECEFVSIGVAGTPDVIEHLRNAFEAGKRHPERRPPGHGPAD